MIKRISLLAAFVVFTIALTGCATDTKNQGNNNGLRQQGNQAQRNWDNQRNNNFGPMHNNTRMQISNQIAEKLTNMDEVETATVLLTDRNAYVAVVLDNGNGYGASNTGRSVGKNNVNAPGTRSNQNTMGDNATTDQMGRNGYGVADDGLTDELKSKIAKKVKSAQSDVENVYVSANPDFVSRMQGYGQRFQNGRPITGLIIEFNTMVERIFPTASNQGNQRNR